MTKQTNFDFEELHITKRPDNGGFSLKARGIWYGDPCTIDIPKMKQPSLILSQEVSTEYQTGNYLSNTYFYPPCLEIKSIVSQDNDEYYSITIDEEHLTKKQMQQLQNEINMIKDESKETIKHLQEKLNQLLRK